MTGCFDCIGMDDDEGDTVECLWVKIMGEVQKGICHGGSLL